MFGSNQESAKQIADMLAPNWCVTGIYSVIERKQLDHVLQEQNFSRAARDPASAVRLAKTRRRRHHHGSITHSAADDKKLGIGGGVRVGGIASRHRQRSPPRRWCRSTPGIVSTTTAGSGRWRRARRVERFGRDVGAAWRRWGGGGRRVRHVELQLRRDIISARRRAAAVDS